MHHSEGIQANTEFEYLRNILFQVSHLFMSIFLSFSIIDKFNHILVFKWTCQFEWNNTCQSHCCSFKIHTTTNSISDR
jgi:hypothetical protein